MERHGKMREGGRENEGESEKVRGGEGNVSKDWDSVEKIRGK